MQLRWDHARPTAGAEGRKTKPNRSHKEQGLEVKNALSPSGRGRKMSLTFPLIDQAISLKTLPGILSATAIFHRSFPLMLRFKGFCALHRTAWWDRHPS